MRSVAGELLIGIHIYVKVEEVVSWASVSHWERLNWEGKCDRDSARF